MIKIVFKDERGNQRLRLLVDEKSEEVNEDVETYVTKLLENDWYKRNLSECTYEIIPLPSYEDTLKLLDEMMTNPTTCDALETWVEECFCNVCERESR